MIHYKNYKTLAPEQTIRNIRNILNDIGIIALEKHRVKHSLHSCRINIGNTELQKLNIGTNGKGNSFEFSMASGYAEMIERLQNRMLFDFRKTYFASKWFTKTLPKDSLFLKKLKEKELAVDFLYDINEEYWTGDRVIEKFGEELIKLFNFIDKKELETFFGILQMKDFLMVPCFSVCNDNEIMVPIELVMSSVGTTGMAAGNSYDEAILQGFCEIFERWAVSDILCNRLTPPSIPLDEFVGTFSYQMIKELTAKGLEITVKDCSLGKGIPVIGTIIIDRKNMQYNFQLGSDFVPHIALERCLTEVYQTSSSGFQSLPFQFLYGDDDDDIKANYDSILINGTGLWPISIFYSKPSYEFEGFNSQFGLSNSSDLKYCIDLMKTLGLNVYIRNNSILGFPTFYVFIPGLINKSMKLGNHKEKILEHEVIQGQFLCMKLGKLTRDETMVLSKSIEDLLLLNKKFSISNSCLYNTSEDLNTLNVNLLLSMLFFRLEKYEKAKKFIDLFIESNSFEKTENKTYYRAISEYISLRYIRKMESDDINNIMCHLFGKQCSEEIKEDLSDPDKIFQYYNFPTCFNCESCKVQASCQYFEILTIEKRLNNVCYSSHVSQTDFRNLFGCSAI